GYAPHPRRCWHKEPVVTSPARATDTEFLAQGQASQWDGASSPNGATCDSVSSVWSRATCMLLGEKAEFPHPVAAFPPPGCAPSPGIDVSPERIGRACRWGGGWGVAPLFRRQLPRLAPKQSRSHVGDLLQIRVWSRPA